MDPPHPLVLAASGVGFDLLLIAHVASALVGFGAVAVSGAQAARLLRLPGAIPDDLRRYYAPGINWAGRVLYLVPALGAALVADSPSLGFALPWVEAGLGLWAVSILVAEALLWPAERRIQRALAAPEGTVGAAWMAEDGRLVVLTSALVVGAFLGATVLMVAQPS